MKKVYGFLMAALIASSTIAQTGYDFNSSEDDVINIPHNDAYTFDGDFTVEAVIKAQTEQTTYPIILSNRGTNSKDFLFGLWSDGRPYVRMAPGNYFYNLGTGTDLRDDQCHHIAFTRSNDTVYLYVDGIYEAEIKVTAVLTSLNGLKIGNDKQTSGVEFNGAIREVRLWNTSRSNEELSQFKNKGLKGDETGLIGYWKLNETDSQLAKDYSSNANDGVLGVSVNTENTDPNTGVTMCTPPMVNAEGMLFNSSEDDVVNIAHNDVYTIDGDFSVEAIIQADQSQTTYPIILSNRGSNSDDFLFGLWSDGRPYVRMAPGNYFYNKGTGTDLRDGKCHHIAFSRITDTVRLYVDGVYETELRIGATLTSKDGLKIGNDKQSSGVEFNGGIKEVRFWNIGRTEEEIINSKEHQLSGNENGLIGYWKLNDVDQIVVDYSITMNDGVLGLDNNVESIDPSTSVTFCGDVINGLNTELSALTVYPNPTSGLISISENNDQSIINVFNNLGTLQLSSIGNTIDISSLPNGIYIIKTDNRISKVLKF